MTQPFTEPEWAGPASLLEWLELTHEEPMEPLLPIVDPHHHLWTRKIPAGDSTRMNEATYLSFGGTRGGLAIDYMVPELLADIEGNNVTHTCYLECNSFYDTDATKAMAPVGETRQCQAFADECAAAGKPLVNAGIISHADLSLGAAVGPVLDAHMAFKNFKGIRDSCSCGRTSAWLLAPSAVRSLAFSLTYL